MCSHLRIQILDLCSSLEMCKNLPQKRHSTPPERLGQLFRQQRQQMQQPLLPPKQLPPPWPCDSSVRPWPLPLVSLSAQRKSLNSSTAWSTTRPLNCPLDGASMGCRLSGSFDMVGRICSQPSARVQLFHQLSSGLRPRTYGVQKANGPP